jgi:hypothetical protein
MNGCDLLRLVAGLRIEFHFICIIIESQPVATSRNQSQPDKNLFQLAKRKTALIFSLVFRKKVFVETGFFLCDWLRNFFPRFFPRFFNFVFFRFPFGVYISVFLVKVARFPRCGEGGAMRV